MPQVSYCMMEREGVQPVPSTSCGCQRCGSLTYSQEWQDAFGLMLCNQCKRDEPLMPKGKAKQLYLLTDKDFRELGFISKDNPQKRSWTAMKLYVQSQLEDIAHKRWGGEEGLLEERQRRSDLAIDQRLKRKREDKADKEGEDAEQQAADSRLAAQLSRVREEHLGPRSIECAEVEAEEF